MPYKPQSVAKMRSRSVPLGAGCFPLTALCTILAIMIMLLPFSQAQFAYGGRRFGAEGRFYRSRRPDLASTGGAYDYNYQGFNYQP